MSNERYSYANQAFLSGQINWISDTIKVCLVDTAAYTFLKDIHQSLADIPSNARVAISPALTGKIATGGVATADDAVLPNVTGPVVGAVVLFKDTGVELTSTLIAYLDTLTGLPVNPQGQTITITWDTGPLGIFTL